MNKNLMKKIIKAFPFLFLSSILYAGNNPCTPLQGCTGISNNNANTLNLLAPIVLSASVSSALDINSSTLGSRPYPAMTQTQRNAISSPENGLTIYDTTTQTLDYYDGTQWQQVLTLDNVEQGANMSITNLGNGKLLLASTGGGSGGTQVQGSFTSGGSTSATSVTTSDSPIALGGLYFNVINAVGMNVSQQTVSGVNTATIQNTSSTGRWGIARFDLTMNFQTSGTNTLAFTVYTSAGVTTYFKNITVNYSSGTNQPFSFSSPLIYLNTNDYMYLTVSCATGSASFYARNFEGSWVDTTIAGLTSTDSLAEGSSNFYMSEDGGISYRNISGSLTPGNVVAANTTGGQLIDSGIAVTNIIQSGTSAGGDLSGSYPNPTVSKINSVPIASSTISDGQLLIGSTSSSNLSAATLTGTTNEVVVTNGSHSITLSTPQDIGTSSSPQFSGLNLSGLSVSQAVVSDGSKNLISLPYTNANTASTLVERDSSGNFNAGTITAALNGNASTVTTNANLTGDVTSVGNATTLATVNSNTGSFGSSSVVPVITANGKGLITAVSTATITPAAIGAPTDSGTGATGTWGISITGNANTATTATNANNSNTTVSSSNTSFYLPFVSSSSSGYQSLNINSNLNYNPLSGVLTLPNITLTAPSANQLLGLNVGNNLVAIGAGTSTTVLHGNASGLPTYSSVSLVNDITGTLGGGNGGLGFSTATTGDIFLATSTNTPGKLSDIATGSVLSSGGVGAVPAWLAYTPANTASTIVSRDSSGNFNASTITATLNGNASTATTATNANDFFTTAVSNNASFYPILVNSTSNSYQAANLNSGFSINPSTGTVTATALTLTGLSLRSVLYAAASGGINQDNSNFVYDGSGHNLFIGSNSISPNGVGRLNLKGTDSTVGNSEVFYTSIDAYPQLQILPFTHDNISLSFDGYYSSGWVSSSSNSSFQITKTASALDLSYGIAAAGSALTWSTGLALSDTGTVTIPELTANSLVTTGTGGLLVSTNTLSSTVLGNITKATVTTFTGGASGNYTPPAGCTHIVVQGWGGGGGGGGVAGAAASAGAAGGGGSGGYFQILLTAPFGGAPFAYTVGSGGAGGASGANNGSVGGNTTFGSITAGHGAGGSGVTSGVSAAIGGGGNITASSGTADIITTGNGGSPGFALSSSIAVGGNGATAPAGGGGGRGGLTGNGGAGGVPGGGGAGGSLTSNSNVAGGAGADGKLLIYEYYNG